MKVLYSIIGKIDNKCLAVYYTCTKLLSRSFSMNL